jgi:dTMP kinase
MRLFISLEGIEGSGKSTQIHYLRAHLTDKGYQCLSTREPGGTDIGMRIRQILLDPAACQMDPLAELLLYMADRAQHLAERVIPALNDGTIVLCDRYCDATLVYQGVARGLGSDLIAQMHRLTFNDLKPDLTLLLDLPPEIGLQRAWGQINSGGRSDAETRFERETLSFHATVRAGYLELAGLEPQRFKVIDAAQSERQVRRALIDAINPYLEKVNP